MKVDKKIIIISAVILISLGFLGGSYWYKLNSAQKIDVQKTENQTNNDTTSPYVGQEIRGIKSLSEDEVKGLLKGEGTPFNGMAKLAELNGYPGPRHVLDMAEELNLTAEQQNTIEDLYDKMRNEAIVLGKQIIEKEDELSSAFEEKTITEDQLQHGVANSASLYSDLRFIHLKYHLAMIDILTATQVEKYNSLRGYTSLVDPCENVPEGHDPELWKMHNGCL
jgi:Spy/CpxP family protein refolding chaperone